MSAWERMKCLSDLILNPNINYPLHQTPPGPFRHIGGRSTDAAAAELGASRDNRERQTIQYRSWVRPQLPAIGIPLRPIPFTAAPFVMGALVVQYPAGPQMAVPYVTSAAASLGGYTVAPAPAAVMVGMPTQGLPPMFPKVTLANQQVWKLK